MTLAEMKEWAVTVLLMRGISEHDVFETASEEKIEIVIGGLIETGQMNALSMFREAVSLVAAHPSRELVKWAEEVLEWDGTGLIKGADPGHRGNEDKLRKEYLRSHGLGEEDDYTVRELELVDKARRVARALRNDKWGMMAAKVRHAARVQRKRQIELEDLQLRQKRKPQDDERYKEIVYACKVRPALGKFGYAQLMTYEEVRELLERYSTMLTEEATQPQDEVRPTRLPGFDQGWGFFKDERTGAGRSDGKNGEATLREY